jgi:hypothetical protein
MVRHPYKWLAAQIARSRGQVRGERRTSLTDSARYCANDGDYTEKGPDIRPFFFYFFLPVGLADYVEQTLLLFHKRVNRISRRL